MPKVSDIQKKVKQVMNGAPAPVKEAAQNFLDSILDFPPNAEMGIAEANRIFQQDLPSEFKGKFSIK